MALSYRLSVAIKQKLNGGQKYFGMGMNNFGESVVESDIFTLLGNEFDRKFTQLA